MKSGSQEMGDALDGLWAAILAELRPIMEPLLDGLARIIGYIEKGKVAILKGGARDDLHND